MLLHFCALGLVALVRVTWLYSYGGIRSNMIIGALCDIGATPPECIAVQGIGSGFIHGSISAI